MNALLAQWPPKVPRSKLRVLRRGEWVTEDEARVVTSTVLPPGDRSVVTRAPSALKDSLRAALMRVNTQMAVAISLKNFGEMIRLFDQKMELKMSVGGVPLSLLERDAS